MKIKIFILAAIAISCFALSISAQGKPAPKFTSVYTSLKTTCRDFDGSNGSDGYSICKGPGGYQVRIYYSAASTHINAERKGKDDNFPLATASVGFDWGKTKLEWRLANGKPFAVIIRIPKYAEPADGEYYGKVNGQELVVAGLLGYEDLRTKVDAKTAGANALAREAADSAYLSKN
ncbi:MAG: hypothetical protein WBC19_12830 [Pyrinomonadaceae bacterium]|nr:hypothetical protein [Pyrinomonadaceae bacterium]